jgi:hypothetical protein
MPADEFCNVVGGHPPALLDPLQGRAKLGALPRPDANEISVAFCEGFSNGRALGVFREDGRVLQEVHGRKSLFSMQLLLPFFGRQGWAASVHGENRAMILDAAQGGPIMNMSVPKWVRPPATAVADDALRRCSTVARL